MKSIIPITIAAFMALPICASPPHSKPPRITPTNGCAVANLWKATEFSLTTTNCETVVVTNRTEQQLEGRFWLAWVVETNAYSSRLTMQNFASTNGNTYLNYLSVVGCISVTNITGSIYGSHWYEPPPPPPTEGDETYYVTSNLFFYVVWRGRTNSDCLESIPVRTEVRHWKIEQKKVYTP